MLLCVTVKEPLSPWIIQFGHRRAGFHDGPHGVTPCLMYWTSSIETNYGQLRQFYCENWGFNPLELRRCNLVSSHYCLLRIWLWPWIAPIDGNFISENDGQPDFSWGTTSLDNPNPILLVISFYAPNIYPWYHDMAYNPLSLLLKHSPQMVNTVIYLYH